MVPRTYFHRLWMRLNGSLRARLFIPIAFFATALMLVMVWAAVQIHGSDLKRVSVERAQLFTNLAAEGIATHMVEGGERELPILVTALKGHRSEIAAVSVTGPDGEVHYSSDPKLIDLHPWRVDKSDGSTPIDTGDTYSLVRPMANEARCAECHGAQSKLNGYLVVSFSKAPLLAAERKLTYSLLLAAIPALVLMLGTTLWLVRREAILPIHRLVVAMRRAQTGDDRVRADEGRPDEIGTTARNFDATMAALRRSRAELEKTYELRMIQADRLAMVGQMATGLAHEIKNPLAGLSGALELMEEDLADTAHRHVIGEMRHQVGRLTRIMESLLSFARPAPAQRRSTHVNSVLEKVLFLVSKQRQHSRIELRHEFADDLPRVHADAAQLEQVFLNIALNAVQAINGDRGTIVLRTFARDGLVHVEIRDDGPGIAPEIREHVFTPFFTTRTSGSGLGLAICARLVSENGGNVRFHCPPEGGTTFTVTFPVEHLASASEPTGIAPRKVAA